MFTICLLVLKLKINCGSHLTNYIKRKTGCCESVLKKTNFYLLPNRISKKRRKFSFELIFSKYFEFESNAFKASWPKFLRLRVENFWWHFLLCSSDHLKNLHWLFMLYQTCFKTCKKKIWNLISYYISIILMETFFNRRATFCWK